MIRSRVFLRPPAAGFTAAFEAPTRPQTLGWPAIADGDSTLILAPTGSGKTLTAFLWCLDRLMFTPAPAKAGRCRVLYVSPLKALAADVERNLRAPLAGIARAADGRGEAYVALAIAIRTGDTPPSERRPVPARAGRHPDHHAGVALPAAHLERARGAATSSRSRWGSGVICRNCHLAFDRYNRHP